MTDRCGDLPIGHLAEMPEPEPEPAGLTCDEPIKIGLITDLTGGLAIYGTMIQRSFLLGMEYATGAPGTEDNVFMLDDCEIQVLIRDDQGSAGDDGDPGARADRGGRGGHAGGHGQFGQHGDPARDRAGERRGADRRAGGGERHHGVQL